MTQHNWQSVFRMLAQQAPPEGLARLHAALLEDSPRLIQGQSCCPHPAPPDWPTEGACAMTLLHVPIGCTTSEAHAAFGRAAFEVDRLCGCNVACFVFLNWFDSTPREQMRRELLAEVEAMVAEFVESTTKSLNERKVTT